LGDLQALVVEIAADLPLAGRHSDVHSSDVATTSFHNSNTKVLERCVIQPLFETIMVAHACLAHRFSSTRAVLRPRIHHWPRHRISLPRIDAFGEADAGVCLDASPPLMLSCQRALDRRIQSMRRDK
jgi:hypothetical protein